MLVAQVLPYRPDKRQVYRPLTMDTVGGMSRPAQGKVCPKAQRGYPAGIELCTGVGLRYFFLILVAAVLVGCSGSRRVTMPAPVVDSRGAITPPRFEDSDPFEWIGRKPWSYPIHGVDVARYQGDDINWLAVRHSGVSFAYVKATEGGDHLDELFKQNWRGVKRAGLLRGAYHYFYFCRPANEQARWFIKHVPNDPKMLPPVLDIEWTPYSPTCRIRPEPHKVRAEMQVFLNRIQRHYGKVPLVYTTPDFYHRNELWKLQGVEFWLRSVADHPHARYPGRRWAFWQYTGTGIVPGIKGNADINVFSGSAQQWKVWLSARGVTR